MNKELDEIKKNIQLIKVKCCMQVEDLLNQARPHYAAKIEADAGLSNAIEREIASVKESKRLIRWNVSGPIYQVVDSEFDVLMRDDEIEQRLYADYLYIKYGCDVDYENGLLGRWIGHVILIDENGNVSDQRPGSSNHVISGTDFKSESERNKLIRSWMTNPVPVVSCDKNGNISYVDIEN